MIGDGDPAVQNAVRLPPPCMNEEGKPMHKSDGNGDLSSSEAADDNYELFVDSMSPKDVPAKAAAKPVRKGYLSLRDDAVEVKGVAKRRFTLRSTRQPART